MAPTPSKAALESSKKAPKLKPTCTLCAASKIKCSRDKPECTRCQERNLKCDYVVSKRAGRPSQTKKSTNTTALSHPQDSESNAPASSPSDRASPLSDATRKESPSRETMASSTNDLSVSCPPMHSSSTLTPGLTSALDTFDPFHPFTLDPPAVVDEFPGFIPDFADNFNPVLSEDFLNLNYSLPGVSTSQNDSASHAQTCECLSKAVGFLTELRSSSKDAALPPVPGAVPTIDTVITRNRTILESTKRVLECSCIHDEVLMVIINLVMMQIMTWYAAIVSDQSMSDQEASSNGTISPNSQSQSSQARVLKLPTTIDGYHLDGGDNDRMAAQLVLSELHSVHRLVNKLSREMNISRQPGSPGSTDRKASVGTMDLDDGNAESGNDTASISTQTMKQLQTDTCKSLRSVSLQTVRTLQQ